MPKKETDFYAKKNLTRYLLTTVHEVIENARKPVPVLDKNGNPTGNVDYQAATVLKACELMAKLMGTVTETAANDAVCIRLVSYKDCDEKENG